MGKEPIVAYFKVIFRYSFGNSHEENEKPVRTVDDLVTVLAVH
jgi:hypothetical protein